MLELDIHSAKHGARGRLASNWRRQRASSHLASRDIFFSNLQSRVDNHNSQFYTPLKSPSFPLPFASICRVLFLTITSQPTGCLTSSRSPKRLPAQPQPDSSRVY
jgi:hypothetical protein